ALKVSDVAAGHVHVVHSKSGRARTVPLSKEGREFFAAQIAGKLGDEPVSRDSTAEAGRGLASPERCEPRAKRRRSSRPQRFTTFGAATGVCYSTRVRRQRSSKNCSAMRTCG